MGYCPDWYEHLRASKYLGVAPWELLEQPNAWKAWALQAEMAEAEANHQKQQSSARKAR